jgi:hypothetical protein
LVDFLQASFNVGLGLAVKDEAGSPDLDDSLDFLLGIEGDGAVGGADCFGDVGGEGFDEFVLLAGF